MQKISSKIISFYQKYLSFETGVGKILVVSDKTCRYSPSCSEYTKQAVEKYGILKGGYKGLLRILRCHPWSAGGWDPVK